MKTKIYNIISSSVDNYKRVLNNIHIQKNIEQTVRLATKAFKDGKKMLLCGNGGSASDAQHIASELSGRFYKDRPPLYAEALHVNSSYLTAVANDYGYEETYARLIDAISEKGDVLVGLSTSGNSINVLNAIKRANKIGLTTIGFTGIQGGKMKDICDITIQVPSGDTARIQEVHMLVGHIICQLIEEEMFPSE